MSSFTPTNEPVPVTLATGFLPVIITLIDGNMSEVATGLGKIETEVLPGIYMYRLSNGEAEQEAFVQIGSDGLERLDLDTELNFRFSMPLPSSTRGQTVHARLERQNAAGKVPVDHGRFAITVNVSEEGAPVELPTWTCQLFDSEFNEIPIDNEDWDIGADDQIAVLAKDLEPGGYTLRWFRTDPAKNNRIKEGFRHLDQSIWISKDWTTFVFTEFDRDRKRIRKSRSLICFLPIYEGYNFDDGFVLTTETASRVILGGLQRGYVQLDGEILQFLLSAKFSNPMLGIMACHALIYRKSKSDRLLLMVLDNMANEMPDNPDIRALQLSIGSEKGANSSEGAEWPPMLYASYALLLNDDWSSKGQAIKQDSKAEMALTTLLGQGPWTMWLTPEEDTEVDDELETSFEKLMDSEWMKGISPTEIEVRAAPTKRHTIADKRAELRVMQYLNRASEEYTEDERDDTDLESETYRTELAKNIGLPRASVNRALASVMSKKRRGV